MNNNSFDKVFDVILDDAAKKADEKLGNMLEDYEGEIEYSKSHKRKMKKLFKKHRRKANRKRNIKTAFICIVIILISFLVSFILSEQFRVNVLNTYLEIKETINFSFSIGNGETTTYKDENIELGYLPKGFELEKNKGVVYKGFYKFKKGHSFFHINIVNDNFKSSVDTENSVSKPIKINNIDGLHFSNNNEDSIVFNIEKYSVRISGNISKNNIVKIAEKLKILK